MRDKALSKNEFRKMIIRWWKQNRRDLPWRRTRDPYRILVSEVMLQQTQVSRVLPKYEEFLLKFSDVRTLAQASPASILKSWKGMGYNRRALYLHKTAQTVVQQFNGIFPDSEYELVKLPGLGRYTARALMVFAFEKDIAMVDTNIRQIITHFFFNDLPQSEKIIQETADSLLPKGKSWEWHQALMDYGALELKKQSKPRVVRKTVPFKDSTRYYRGRIVDVLRENHMKEKSLMQHMQQTYQKREMFVQTIISGLIRDGLIVRSGDMLHLPE